MLRLSFLAEEIKRLYFIFNFAQLLIEIDNELIQEALKLGGHRTKRAVVEAALQEYVQRRKQLTITELFGTIEYEDDYDYKQQRRQS